MTELKLTSPAFIHNSMIPDQYTFYHENISPPLRITGIPENTQSYALIMFDPIAKTPGFVHWVVYNIPKEIEQFEADLDKDSPVLDIGTQGLNGKAELGYRGCGPGPGPAHPYHFHLYATDLKPDLPQNLNAAQLRDILVGHILAETELIGYYQQT